MTIDVSAKEYLQHIASSLLLGIWIIFVISGFISLINSIISQNLEFIWVIYFSNLLSLVPYAIMFFPTLSIFIILRNFVESKKIEEKPKVLKALLTQILTAAISSLIIVLILGEPILTINIALEFFSLLSLWIFFISIITLVVFVLYSYFGEA
jgi:hypothetical protein